MPLHIGEWWVDPVANELGRDSETVRIEPKAMQVLIALAATPGRVLTREQLLDAVWSGVVVGDEALTQTVIKLRRALGDNPRSPSYIQTISKRGYRLVAEVRRNAAVSPAQGSEHVAAASPADAAQRKRIVGAARLAGTLLVLAAVAYGVRLAMLPAPEVDAFTASDAHGAPITVAVLPFESLGTAEDQAYLARGISDDLMADLSRLPGVRLIRALAAPDSRAPRGARYVVLGTVRKESGVLRVNIHMLDTAINQEVWSQRFERPFADLFAIQDEIVRNVTEQLPARLTDAERRRLSRRHTPSLEAYDWFLRAQSLFLLRQAGVNEEARSAYRKAIELDPKFARAYAGLAMTYAMDNRLRLQADSAIAQARAFELAETARGIDPEIPEVYWALAFVHVQSRQHERAIEHLQKAIELNRSFADAYAFMGGIYTYVGQATRTIPLLRTSLRLSPDGGYLYYLLLGRAYLFEGDSEQALINLREAAARNPVDIETRVYLAAASAAAGEQRAAEWEALEIRAIDPQFSIERWMEAYPLRDARYKEKLAGLLAKAAR